MAPAGTRDKIITHRLSSGLESTSIVFVFGLDLYGTRVDPSKGFDLLKVRMISENQFSIFIHNFFRMISTIS